MDKEQLLAYMNNRKQTCRLEIMDIYTKERQVLKEFSRVIEAPNWTNDGCFLIYNSGGKLYSYEIETGNETCIDTGYADLCNNDHVLSPDNKYIAVSHSNEPDFKSRIYILPLVLDNSPKSVKETKHSDLVPRLVTQTGPSYLHGWSPNKEELAFCGERHGVYDIYTIDLDGNEERQLTDSPGLDDGPEYSPDGKEIWFNSTRSGLMQVWKMDRNGENQVRVLEKEMNCWFPHISPDGEKVVYIGYFVGDLDPLEHLPDKKVQLRLMNRDGSGDHLLAEFNGGQGTINVNSWSPCSKKIAYVTY